MGTREVARSPNGAVSSQKPLVHAVSQSARHHFHKQPQLSIQLVAGLGVEGDAHQGSTVQHLSRKRYNPDLPNLRQVHLMHEELFGELAEKGFQVRSGEMGENITTRHLDLLQLPRGIHLHIGQSAIVAVTGLRNPCVQMDRFLPGLMAAVLDRDEDGGLIRKAGIMGIVIESGPVHAGDAIRIVLPARPHRALEAV